MNVRLPQQHGIGAEITDLSITSVSDREIADVKALVYEHKLVIFRGQDPSDEEYIDFARKLGTPQIYFQAHYHHPDHPEIFVSSNELWDGKKFGVSGTGRYWHTDYSFMAEPLPLTMVLPKRIPEGNRGTYYINMQRVYEELPPQLRSLVEGRRAIHEGKFRYKIQESDIDRALIDILRQIETEVPAVTHPCVIRHPVSRAGILYINEGFTTGFVGMSHEESAAALADLLAWIAQERHVHLHPWQAGDLLLWDNRALLHMASATPKGQLSTSYRIGVYDGLPFYTNAQEGSS